MSDEKKEQQEAAVSASRSLAEWDWIQIGQRVTLHAPRRWDDDAIELGCDENAETMCGLVGFGVIPGLFSRMGCRRCAQCCDSLGYPRGKGSPKNDDRCRPLVEARLTAASRVPASGDHEWAQLPVPGWRWVTWPRRQGTR